MIEIRTYDGDGEDAADLIGRTWRAAYGGKTWCPVWTADYLRWQLLSGEAGERDFLVAAYDGRKLVGCFFAKRATFQVLGRDLTGTIGSWFSVDPEARAPRLGMEIIEELRRRHVEHEAAFLLGVVNGDPSTVANKFWTSYAKLFPDQIRFVRRIGYWIRVLDAASVRGKYLHRSERLAARMHGMIPFLRPPRSPAREVREYRDADLDRCAPLVAALVTNTDFALTIPRHRLAPQLCWYGVPQTLVHDVDNGPFGLVNYHRIGLLGSDVVSAGLIDLLGCEGGSVRVRRRLLRSAVARMAAGGTDIAFALRTPTFPARVMVPAGFAPLPKSEHLVLVFPRSDLDLPSAKRPFVLFR